MQDSETEISTLGEFGLIDELTKDFKIKNKSTQYGVGDDCAALTILPCLTEHVSPHSPAMALSMMTPTFPCQRV